MITLFNGRASKRSVVLRALLLLLVLYVVYKSIDIGKKANKTRLLNSTASEFTPPLTYPPFVFHASRQGVVRLLAVGDTGANSPEQREVASAMEERCQTAGGIDGVLMLGDLIYPNGVESADDTKWQTHFEDYYRKSPCLSAAMVYPVLGNHDYLGQPVAWLDRARRDDQWYFPSRSWTRQLGEIVTLWGVDSEVPWFGGMFEDVFASSVPGGQSASFEKKSLNNLTSPWRVALGHHPIESASQRGGRHKGGGLAGRRVRDGLCGKVDIYLSGHAHHMEHRYLSDCALELLIVGSGGAGLQAVDEKSKDALFVAGQFGFAELELSRSKIDIRLFDRSGVKVYGYTKITPP